MKHHYNPYIMRLLHSRHPELSLTKETALDVSKLETLLAEGIEAKPGSWFPQAFVLLQEGDALEGFQEVGSAKAAARERASELSSQNYPEMRRCFLEV